MFRFETRTWDSSKHFNSGKTICVWFSYRKHWTEASMNEASSTYTARHVNLALIVLSVTRRLKRFLLSYDRGHVWTELAGLSSVCSRATGSSHKHERKWWQPCWHQTHIHHCLNWLSYSSKTSWRMLSKPWNTASLAKVLRNPAELRCTSVYN